MAWLGTSGVTIVADGLTGAGRSVLGKAIRRIGDWKEEMFCISAPDDLPPQTRAVLAAGPIATAKLTGYSGGKRDVKYIRGYPLPSFVGLPVVPTFDPNKLPLGQMKLFGILINDINVALSCAQGKRGIIHDPKSTVDYKEGLGALRALVAAAKADPTLLISFDLETEASSKEDEDEIIEYSRDSGDEASEAGDEDIVGDDSEGEGDHGSGGFSRGALDLERATITTVQFSLRARTGVSCPWTEESAALTQELFNLSNPRAGHNTWLFDIPILRNHGIKILDIGHDTLWMYHHLQPDLPAHLQGVASFYGMEFPWKHYAGSDLAWYGAADVDAVQRIMSGLPKAMERLGIYQSYERFVATFRYLLADLELRGIPVSREKLAELREWLTAEVRRMDRELQPLVPSEVKGRKFWTSWPAETKSFVNQLKEARALRIRQEYEAEGKKLTKKALAVVIKPADLNAEDRLRLTETTGYQWDGNRLFKELPFNPRSPLQIKDYLTLRGYPIPKRFKDGKDTTSDKELERLEVKTKDPVLKLTRSIRAYNKMENGYAGKLLGDGSIKGGWQPGPDGRLRSTITCGPATGQLAARNPNVMTSPKRRAELAFAFRKCIQAEPGHKIIECVAPDTPILMYDMNWKKAGDVEIGEEVVGFDEQPVTKFGSKRSTRYLRRAQVISKTFLRKPCVRIKTEDFGTVKCSNDHLWLVRRNGKARWIEAGDIKVGETICSFTWPWEQHQDYEAGWLAGFLDGEGFCSDSERSGRGVGFGQNSGPVADKAVRLIEDLGFVCRREKTTTRDCIQYHIGGHQFAWLRLLGMVRPIRLLSKAIRQLDGMAYWGKRSRSAVVTSVEDVGEHDVVALGTTTGTFIANGMLSHNCDYRAFHAKTLGLAARNPDYCRLADMDIHSFVAGHMIKWPNIETCLSLSDSDLRAFLAEIKEQHKRVRDFKAKPAILGIGFKMGKGRLYFENRDSYDSPAEAGKLIDLLRRLFPSVFKWQDDIVDQVDRTGYLINSWGAIRWFWDAKTWVRDSYGRWQSRSGRDAEKITAYLPSSNAHYMLRDKLLQAQALDWLNRYGLINIIHDAILFHCPDGLVDECVHNIKTLMEAPVPQMADPLVCPDGFVCAAEASVGTNWAPYNDNPEKGPINLEGMREVK